MSAGINLHSLGEGLVPVFEEHEARSEANKEMDEWYVMSPMARAFIVAQRRIRIAMKNLQAEAEIDKSIRESNKVRKK